MSGRVISRIGVVTALAAAVAASGCAAGGEHGVAGAREDARPPLRGRCRSARRLGERRLGCSRRSPADGVPLARPRGDRPLRALNANGVPNVLGILGERSTPGAGRRGCTWRCRSARTGSRAGSARAACSGRPYARASPSISPSVACASTGREARAASRAAVGSSATPTPLGRYYVNQRLVPRDPSGRSARAPSASRRSRRC